MPHVVSGLAPKQGVLQDTRRVPHADTVTLELANRLAEVAAWATSCQRMQSCPCR